MLVVHSACQREIAALPDEIRADLADAIARLDAGLMLSMPLSRPMPEIGHGVHELRFKDRSGAYRVIYALVRGGNTILVHTFKKTSRATAIRSRDTARRRLKEIGR